MKHFLSLICVLALLGALVACGSKKEEKPEYEEQVTKEVPAEEGGKVESSDGNTSIEIPGGALDEDTKITMRIYDAQGYVGTEGQHVLSKVVEFEPSGLIFKKPVVITMINNENTEGKVITAAVYRESKGEWSYNEHGAYAVLAGRDAAGDPIMQSAAGDPIMLSAAGDPIMQSAAGDPIMMAAAGDPIMLASAGDPIMSNAAGDPIMNAAAGDPIMMTTGHFTAYTFITFLRRAFAYGISVNTVSPAGAENSGKNRIGFRNNNVFVNHRSFVLVTDFVGDFFIRNIIFIVV